ncbi:MAG: penicillin-binding protein 2 [Solirubrobacterales bacterium]|nr:penicillin-binding protein 2 [Solirubrobacterales bacterium]
MIQLPEDRRPPLTPQLALRVAVLGSFALAMFAIVFFRLWFLQVLSGDQYIAQAQQNQVRNLAIAAPRGDIIDRNGQVLVTSKRAMAVQISPNDLPRDQGAQRALFRNLAGVLGISTKPGRCPVAGKAARQLAQIPCDVAQQEALLPYANVTVKTDVSPAVQYFLAERQDEFPGVNVEQVYLRSYPLTTLAAQLFGTVGPIDRQEVHELRYRGVPQTAIIGKTGLEWNYDSWLRGEDGTAQIQVDSLGRFTGYLSRTSPTPGHNLKLSLDVNLQRAGQQALQHAIDSNPPSNGGAFVAMNPVNGEVYAMGSLPTFDPNIFTKTISKATYQQLNNPASNFPLINRAIQSAGPTGSTFKPITATAALQSGAWSLANTFDDTGQFCVGSGPAQQCRHNAGNAVDGQLDLVGAIRVSSDDFFYNLGDLTNADPTVHPNGGALQQWARAFGIGRTTGIDLRDELPGTLPSPRWRTGRDKLELECEQGTGPFAGKGRHANCGIADGRPWSVGDNISLAVGQGDVQVTPLQLAVAYSAIANGGTVVRPHLGLDVEQPDGTVLQRIDPPAARHVAVDASYLDAIRTGLHDAAQSAGGTSNDVFGNFPEQVYGKTGTAQYTGQQDYSWYACFVPPGATSTPIVVVVWVEQGGFGAQAAAPAARQILSDWFFGKPGPFVAGSSKTL